MRRLSGLLVLALTIGFAGCTSLTQTAVGERHPWTVPHVLRFADVAEPDRLNPYLSQMDVSYALTSLVYSYLIVSNDRGELIGDLALEVPTVKNGGISTDGRTYTYHLRKGVKWHDGVPFTARDVVASWRAVVAPRNLTLYRQGYDQVASIETPDDLTVVVHLKQRYPPFVTQFFAPLQEGGKPILPAHVIERESDFNTGTLSLKQIGTGPFTFVSWRHGERIVLARNDAYFRGRPKLERIEFRVLPDGQTELNETELHHVDLIYAPPAALYSQYKRLSGVDVYTVPWNYQGVMVVNTGKPGLNDVNVRRAISLAIDRKSIIDHVLQGLYPLPSDVIASTAIGYVKRPAPRYDPDAANRLLDANGWVRGPDGIRSKNGVRLDYTISTIAGSATFMRMPVVMQQNLKAIGVNVSIRPYPYNQIFDFQGPIDTYKYDFAIYGTGLSWDPDSHVYYGCDEWFPKGQNFYRYCNPEYDRLERAGFASDNPATRAPLYAKADSILWDTVAYYPLFDGRRIVVRNPDLKNYRPNATSTPWWNAWEWDI